MALNILCERFASDCDISIEKAKEICKKYCLADRLLREYKKFLEEKNIKIFDYYATKKVKGNTFNVYGVTVHLLGYEEYDERVFLAKLSSTENLKEEMGKLNYYFMGGDVKDFWKEYYKMPWEEN